MAGADTCYAIATWNKYVATFQTIVPLLMEIQLEKGEWVEVVSDGVP
jgi:NADH:ubiquinone oxidoreductase subunit E